MPDQDDSSEALRRLAEGDHPDPEAQKPVDAEESDAPEVAGDPPPRERPDAPPAAASDSPEAESASHSTDQEDGGRESDAWGDVESDADPAAVAAVSPSASPRRARSSKHLSRSGQRQRQQAVQRMWMAGGVALAGVLFTLPALWGLLFRMGATEMFAKRSNAEQVALAAILLGGAFALAMFAGAAYLYWQAKAVLR